MTPTATARSRSAGPRLVAAAALARYAQQFAASGGVPNAVLIHPDELTADQSADLQSQWVEARMSSLGLPAVLSGGVEFKTLQFNPTDMALVELSPWNESRIAVLLGRAAVPRRASRPAATR